MSRTKDLYIEEENNRRDAKYTEEEYQQFINSEAKFVQGIGIVFSQIL